LKRSFGIVQTRVPAAPQTGQDAGAAASSAPRATSQRASQSGQAKSYIGIEASLTMIEHDATSRGG
jgi:hypothetical protein